MPPGSVTIRGRRAHAYTSPVMRASVTAISAAVCVRAWMAKSTRLAAANITQAHQPTIAPGSRNTLLWLDVTAWSDDTRLHSSGCDWAAVLTARISHFRTAWSRPGSA